MSKIDVTRELHCYKKMYHIMQDAVIDCADICEDPVIKEKLTSVQKEAEDIYTSEEYIGKALTADEQNYKNVKRTRGFRTVKVPEPLFFGYQAFLKFATFNF